MKKKILWLLVIVSLCFIKSMFAQITFQKAYGSVMANKSYGDIEETSDSGYVITGSGNGVYLLRIDRNGNFLWNKSYGGPSGIGGDCVQQTLDGGYIIGGAVGSGITDAYLIKTDSAGNFQWSKVFETLHYDFIPSLKQTVDSAIIIAGLYDAWNGGVSDVYLIKINLGGDTLWTKHLGGNTFSQEARSIQITNDAGFIIAGFASNASLNRVYLLRTDSSGIPLWTKTYGGSALDAGLDVKLTTDGGYIIVGYTYFGAGNNDLYLVKTDSIGDTLWTKAYGSPGYEVGVSVQQTKDGGYIASGTTSPMAGNYSIYIIKTNSTGDTLWTKTIITQSSYTGCGKIFETSDGGYIIATDTKNPFSPNNRDILLIKTDSLGNGGCNMGNTQTIVTSPPTQVTSLTTPFSSGSTITLPSILASTPLTVVTTICVSTSVSEIAHINSVNIYPQPHHLTLHHHQPIHH